MITHLLLLLVSLAVGCSPMPPPARVPVPAVEPRVDASTTDAVYPSAEKAVDALIAALRTNDPATIESVLGPDAQEIINSGDSVADANNREHFLAAYDKKHSLVDDNDGTKTLVVGDTDWPMPLPLVHDAANNTWLFDIAAGKDEILNRRIGENELSAIQVCLAIVDAQRDYAMKDPQASGVQQYAQRVMSEPGKKNGLFWEAAAGEDQSPLGPLVAEAEQEGYDVKERPAATPAHPRPYHGYCYHLLKQQGDHAAGGAREYVIDGKMIGGFGVVAWPAEYGNSGVMTFIVNQDGVVYERDLGDDTETLAPAIDSFDPGPEWKRHD